MKSLIYLCLSAFVLVSAQPALAQAQARNYGDHRSETLVIKAWQALEKSDIEAVLDYTNKAIELYGATADEMQGSLSAYPKSKDKIFSYWALNDVAAAYYIQGEAYRQANMKSEALQAYSEVINSYAFGQTYDVAKDSFWKPVDAAKEKVAMLESGVEVDYGDYKSQTLVAHAWRALAGNDLPAVVAYVDKTVDLYAKDARSMQSSLNEYPWESNEKIFSYWALNDVGTSLFILAEAYRKAGKSDEAIETYRKLVDDYFYAQAWDPQGWFWKPAEAAQQKLAELGALAQN